MLSDVGCRSLEGCSWWEQVEARGAEHLRRSGNLTQQLTPQAKCR